MRDTHPSVFFQKSEISFGNHFLRPIYILFIVPISKNQLRQPAFTRYLSFFPFSYIRNNQWKPGILVLRTIYILLFVHNFQKSAKATRQPAYARYPSFCLFSEIRNKLRKPGNQVLRTIYILFMVTISRNHLRQPGNQHLRDTHPSHFFHKSEMSFGNHFCTPYTFFLSWQFPKIS